MHMSSIIPRDLDNISAENKMTRELVAKIKTSKQSGYVYEIVKSTVVNPLSPSIHPSLGHILFQECVSPKQ